MKTINLAYNSVIKAQLVTSEQREIKQAILKLKSTVHPDISYSFFTTFSNSNITFEIDFTKTIAIKHLPGPYQITVLLAESGYVNPLIWNLVSCELSLRLTTNKGQQK